MFIENYIAENLYAKYRELYYWTLGNEYEVDFLINVNGDSYTTGMAVKYKKVYKTLSKKTNICYNTTSVNV